MENEAGFIKEYEKIEDINLDDDYLIISPTGKIYKLDPDNLKEEFIEHLKNNNVDYNEIIDMINEELYTRGYELDEVKLDDIKRVIKDIFGYIIYDNENHKFSYSKGNCMYNTITRTQENILKKLNESLLKGESLECKLRKYQ